MALRAIMVDRARVHGSAAQPTKIDGSTVMAPVASAWIRCRLELPSSGAPEQQPDRSPRRVVKAPTVYLLPAADGTCPVRPEQRLEVASPELGSAMYRVVGSPGPWRKKRRVIGYQVSLERIDERPRDADRGAA